MTWCSDPNFLPSNIIGLKFPVRKAVEHEDGLHEITSEITSFKTITKCIDMSSHAAFTICLDGSDAGILIGYGMVKKLHELNKQLKEFFV
jgi:hypothetical protein